MSPDPYAYEKQLVEAGFTVVVGADEAGRGACAGPLVAAACVLGEKPIAGLADSKKLTAKKRALLRDAILQEAVAVSWVRIEAEQIDMIGIQEANLQALRRAIGKLEVRPSFAIIDGFSVDGLGIPAVGMWKGDQSAACVSAASIVAKVTRDEIMTAYDVEYPGYGFAGHKGYVTAAHQKALEELGPCPIHRRSYANVARVGES